MVRLTEEVKLDFELPKLPKPESGGGAWPLSQDQTENWAWTDGVFNTRELDAIIKIGNSVELQRATTFGGDSPEVRNSFVNFLFPNSVTDWVFARLAGAIQAVNNQWFGFDLTSMEQGLQFTRYEAPSDHYTWHIDRGYSIGTRKLSLSLQLNDPSEYEGGQFQMKFGDEDTTVESARGRMVVFPSYVLHRVKPVTSGVRYSLVCWVSGPKFK